MNKNTAYILNDEEIVHILVSENKFPSEDTIYTENPALFQRFENMGYNVKSLTVVPLSDLKKLDELALTISVAWQKSINTFCRDKIQCFLNIGDTLNTYIFRLLSLLIYRAVQLNYLIENEQEIIVPVIENAQGFDAEMTTLLPLFVDYFGVLSKSDYYNNKIKTIPLISKNKERKKFYETNVSIAPQFWKYYLLAFFVDPYWMLEMTLKKIMNALSPHSLLLPFLKKKNKIKALIYHPNRILDRSMLPMILNKLELQTYIEPEFKISDIKIYDKTIAKLLYSTLTNISQNIIKEGSFDSSGINHVINMSANRIVHFVMSRIIPLEQIVFSQVSKWIDPFRQQPAVMLSNNSLNQPIPSLIGQCFSKNGVPVIAFEHGALGLMKLHRAHTFFTDLRYWDGFVAYSAYEEKYYVRHTNDTSKNIYVRGFSHIASAKFPRIARRIARSLMGLPKKEPLILYAPTRFRENSIRLFYEYFDIPYWCFMKRLVFNVFGKTRIKTIVKTHRKGLLPSTEYRSHPLNEVELPANINIVNTPDLKYLRFAADVLIIDRLTSTLEWAISCDVPLIYLNILTHELEEDVIPILKKALFVIDISDDLAWEKKLLDLLELPTKVLLEKWNNKKKDREYFCEYFDLGPLQSDTEMIQWIKEFKNSDTL